MSPGMIWSNSLEPNVCTPGANQNVVLARRNATSMELLSPAGTCTAPAGGFAGPCNTDEPHMRAGGAVGRPEATAVVNVAFEPKLVPADDLALIRKWTTVLDARPVSGADTRMARLPEPTDTSGVVLP